MRKRTVALVVVACVGAFSFGVLVGRSTSSPGVRVYTNEVNGKVLMTAYHSDWPTYGLPLAEMAVLNNLMDGGFDADELDRARRLVNGTLDLAVIDARQRVQKLPHLPAAEVEDIRRVLKAARKARQEHPPPDSYEPWEGDRVKDILLQY